jgi:putative membrane protein
MRDSCVWKGVLAGAVGGLVASWAMNEVHLVVNKARNQQRAGRKHQGSGGQNKPEDSEPATVQAAEAISRGLAGHELTESEKQVAGPAVHYAFGALNGALYGAIAEFSPSARVGAGALFGAGLWLAADELAVPAFGLAKAPTEYPASTHAEALASHLVYGLTTEGMRYGIRRLLG